MQRLTVMTLGAALIGLCGFAYDAYAQPPASASVCATHEATIYFSPESSTLNEYADYAVERMAAEAKACGAKGVVVQSAGNDRASKVAAALRVRGVKAVIAPLPALAMASDTMVARSVVLRVAAPGSSLS